MAMGSQVHVVIAAVLSGVGDIIFAGGGTQQAGTAAALQFNNAADAAGLTVPAPGILVVKSPFPARNLQAYHVVVQNGFKALVQAAGGSGGSSGGGAGGVTGVTNATTRTPSGGGPDIPRAATAQEGLAVDVRTEFIGVNSYPPDTQIQPNEAKAAENVDGISVRGALRKRPGFIKTFPDRNEVVNSVPAINPALKGRSINAFPVGFQNNGQTLLLLGYDSRTDLGKGVSASSSKHIRAVPVDPLWHPQKDLRFVRPELEIITNLATIAEFELTMPLSYTRDGSGTRLASVDKVVVIVSPLGFQLDRDNQDKLQGVYLKEYEDWDGDTISIVDVDGEPGDVRYYTVWTLNKETVSEPFTFSIELT